MTYESTSLASPVASSAGGFQQSVQAVHLYPFVAVVSEPATRVDFQFPKHGRWQRTSARNDADAQCRRTTRVSRA